MHSLCEEFYYYCDNNKILPLHFLKKYAYAITKRYKATKYIKKIILGNEYFDYQASYDFDMRIIALYYKELKRKVEQELNTTFNLNNKEHISIFNSYLIISLTHECFHGIQTKIAEDKQEDSLASKIFSDSINIYNYYNILYTRYYDYAPIEVNAEIMANLVSVNFMNLLVEEEVAINNNAYVAEKILSQITDGENFLAKTEAFYKLVHEEKRYYEITKNLNLSNYKRLILGLSIDDDFLNDIEEISRGELEVLDIKKYLKKL